MKRSLSLLNSENDDDANVNLTPLIDVVFVVLIMFILVAPLVEIDRIQLAHATSEKKADMISFQENNELKIYVYKDNTIWLNGVPLTLDELKKALTQFHYVNPTASPQIFHDREAFFGTYQSVKNVAEEVGFESLDVILQPG
ncbi:MAG: biopolymer transporter ExbD [Chlamydiales bacterium]|nr:biopolymer transporter ExbD [Chlamydiia bacterium]MCB1084142.1 biopolymer transporter ExbD [Simkania sp.]MCP5504091.1 biopolymer transporter ExbD [Chlamydiales bacterium]